MNTAILTGHTQSWSLRIYSLSQAGHVTDITSQTTCHSGQEAVLKVSTSRIISNSSGPRIWSRRGPETFSHVAKWSQRSEGANIIWGTDPTFGPGSSCILTIKCVFTHFPGTYYSNFSIYICVGALQNICINT